MPSSEMLRRAALVITDVSEERIASMIRVETISELGTRLAVTSRQNQSEKKRLFLKQLHGVTSQKMAFKRKHS
jgi:hypothetical protein